jgi:hypothetical protein
MRKLRFGVVALLEMSLCLFLAGVLGTRLSGQTSYGTSAGIVTDASGGAIADAQVTITNVASGEKHVQPTGADGFYNFVNLLPGTYRIDVEKPGFKHVTRPDVIVQVGQATRIDFTMQVGEVSQTVEVTAETPLLQQETSSLGQVVEGRKVAELPLNGRNVFNLVTLAPSVVPQGSAGGTPVGVNPFGWGNYQVNGSFGNESAEYLDGQPLNIGYINLPVIIPTQDSVEEFKVQTSNTGADWGKFSGGVMNFSTKSGTNDLHGELYEYLRNRVLNANDPFNKAHELQNGQPNKPGSFTQNQFGANAGGPLWIPHAYDGRDKTFWFFSWEAFRLRQGASPVLTTVPTPTELAGNFAAPGIAPIMDPCGGTVTTAVACPNYTGRPTPFPGNVIPTSRLNPTSLAMEKLWPGANSPCTADSIIGCKNNYAKSYATGGNQNQVVGRMDQTLGTKQRIFFRYSYWNVLDLPQDPLGTGLCQDRCAEKYATSAAAIGYNYNITPTTIAALNASLSRFAYNRSPNNAGFDLTTIHWPASFNTVIPSIARTPPTPCVLDYADNVMCSQGQSFIQDRNTQYDIGPSLTLLRGRHTLKLGYQLEVGRDNYAQTNVASGSFAFCGSGLACFTGNGFADFLLGYADNPSNVENHFFGQTVVPALIAGQQIYNAFYADDTFRVTNKLTLNLGVRYDRQGPWSERFNRLSYFSPTASSWLSSPAAAGLPGVPGLPGLRGDVFLVSPSTRTAIPRKKDEFAPRIGFAYSFDPKTVIRAGYGVFWIPNYVSFGLNPNNDLVNDATTSYTGTINGTVPVNTINTPFPATGVVPPVGRTLGALGTQQYATQVVQNFSIADYYNHPEGYVQQWNLNIQRDLPGGFFFSAAYVGSKGTHLQSYSQQIDQLPDSFLPAAAAQCAAQLAAAKAASPPIPLTRCQATVMGLPSFPVGLLQTVPNPFFDPTTHTSYALSGATTTVGQLDLPYPQYTGLKLAGQGSYDSNYNSLQLTLERRFASAGSILVAYTNAKLISDTDTLTNWLEASNGSIQDNNNNRAERSLSSQDVSQRFVLSYVLDLPFGHGKKYFSQATGAMDKVVGGWGVDGVTIFQKGFPLAFGNAIANYTTSFGGGSRPNVVKGCNKSSPAGAGKLNEWFNTACFAAPADFTYGNESRTDPTLRSSGVNNWDFALFKRTMFGPDERLGIAFRAEFFNMFNRAQWAPPNTSVGSSTFGQVSSIYPGTNPRLIQFGLKFIF